jgi:hypothetical protein
MNGKPGKTPFQYASGTRQSLIPEADYMKGSFYANPIIDNPTVSASEREAYPEYYGKNLSSSQPRVLTLYALEEQTYVRLTLPVIGLMEFTQNRAA